MTRRKVLAAAGSAPAWLALTASSLSCKRNEGPPTGGVQTASSNMASAGGPNQDGLITIRVGGTPPTLSYAPDGNVVKADANSQKPKKHHVVKEDGVSWTCPDGAFAILFEKSPFKQGETSLGGARNSTSRPAKTSSVLKQTTFKYTVVVVTAVGAEPIIDDPELEVDPGGGGPG